MPKLPVLRAKEVIKILKRAGFVEWRQKGSHLTLYHAAKNKTVTIPVHFGKTIPNGTLHAIIKQSELPIDFFVK